MPSRQELIYACVTLKYGALEEILALPEAQRNKVMLGVVAEAEEYRQYLMPIEYEALIVEYKNICAFKDHLDEEFKKLDVVEKQNERLILTGKNRIRQQQKAGIGSHQEDQEKHKLWRKWQAAEKSSNPKFAKQSKQEQAKRLKQKYSIPDEQNTIAKRLAPLPPSKKK